MMLKNYFKIGLRNLWANKVFTGINILGLSIGMTVALLIFLWVQNELTFDAYHPDADKIQRIICHWNGTGGTINVNAVPLRLLKLAEEEIPGIEAFHTLRPELRRPLTRTKSGQVFEEPSFAYVSKGWFEEFRHKVISGSFANFHAAPYSMALTKSYAKKYFGEESPIGQSIELLDRTYVVQLVLDDNPPNSSFQFNGFLPLQSFWDDPIAYEADYNSGNYNYFAFVRMNSSVVPQTIEKQLAQILNKSEGGVNSSCSLIPLTNMRFSQVLKDEEEFKHQDKAIVWLFLMIGIIVLLTASLNYINLATAMLSKKVKNIGVRKVIGANGRQIFNQMMVETTLISMISFGVAMFLVHLFLPFLGAFVELPLQFDFGNWTIWGLLLLIITLSTLVSGIYPALASSGIKPIFLLNENRSNQKGISLRKVLVITQFTAVVIILSSTFVIYQQLGYILNKDVGYDRNGVIRIRPNLGRDGNMERNFNQFKIFKDVLETIPEYEAVAITDAALSNIMNQNGGGLIWEGKPEDLRVNVNQMRANEDLIKVFNLEMAKGRWFSGEVNGDRNNYVLNESTVKQFNIPEPVIGRRVSFQGRQGQVIGVVKDFNFSNLRERIQPLVIWHNNGLDNTILARMNSDDPASAIRKAEEQFTKLLPGIPFEYSYIEDTFVKMHASDQKLGRLFQVFSVLLIFISCLGLLGLSIFAAERRIKEIGIRKVLGASIISIVALLSKDFLKLILVSSVIAIPIAWYLMQHWLANFAYAIHLKWWMFALVGLLIIGIAFLTISFQSFKAALLNPVVSLKDE